jgi:hypothetical protein
MTTQPTPVDPPQLHHSAAFAQGMIVLSGDFTATRLRAVP